jgi:hypothetical protein
MVPSLPVSRPPGICAEAGKRVQVAPCCLLFFAFFAFFADNGVRDFFCREACDSAGATK